MNLSFGQPRQPMLKRAKQTVLQAAKALSIHQRWSTSAWRTNRLLILCYHGIAQEDEHQWDSELYMDQARFRRRMEMLREGGYQVLPLGEACDRLRLGTLPPKSVALTFDDGNVDFATVAWPILREFRYPATVYVSTFYVDHRRPIFRLFCSYLLWKSRNRAAGETLALAPGLDILVPDGLATPRARASALQQIEDFVMQRKLPLSGREDIAAALAQALGIDPAAFAANGILHLMTPEQIARVAAEGADVQLHTHRHRTPLDRGVFLREIDENRHRIAEITGKYPEHFCYPSGETHPAFLPWLRERTVRTATTCVPGLAAPYSDPLLLPRVVDHCHLSETEIESWMAGVSQFLIRRPSGTPHYVRNRWLFFPARTG